MRHAPATLLVALLLLASCASTSKEDAGSGTSWLKPSPTLRRQIEDQITRLPWTHGLERVEQITWFAGIGEPAYPYLLELCADPRPDVAASAVAALGATGDSRLVEPLQQVEWRAGEDKALRFERARAAIRLGDWGQIRVLVDGLEDESAWVRGLSIATLRESTRIDLGYEANGDEAARKAAVQRWREWIARRTSEGIVAARD
jgi:HEAT repeat protein